MNHCYIYIYFLFLHVGTFSGHTRDLHPFVVIFVTKVHMPSPLRTPGRRLDIGGGSGYISGVKAEDRKANFLSRGSIF